MTEPKIDEFCCYGFERMSKKIQWMTYADGGPPIATMPYIQCGDDKMRVNFCPSCGKEIRSINVLKKYIA